MSRATYLLPALFLAATAAPLPAQEVLFSSGNLVVKKSTHFKEEGDGRRIMKVNQLLRDHILFGESYEDAKYRRLATTYYHQRGPLGITMWKFNWFRSGIDKVDLNKYESDARLPASLVAMGASGTAILPLSQIVDLWSEPPLAVIGMNSGTPASYARPLQHLHFYEQTKDVINVNLREGKDPFFHYIPDAMARGTMVRVMEGSPRQQLAKNGPRKFYQLMVMEACSGDNGEKIYLDLFTKEGIAECMEHLAEDGILCVHTSHRFVNLPAVLAAIGAELRLNVRVGHDLPEERDRSGDHFSSEWVMLARPGRLDFLAAPPDYKGRNLEGFWSSPFPVKQVWTDKGPNPLDGVLRGHPFAMRYSAVARPIVDMVLRFGVIDARNSRQWSELPEPVNQFLVDFQLKFGNDVRMLWP